MVYLNVKLLRDKMRNAYKLNPNLTKIIQIVIQFTEIYLLILLKPLDRLLEINEHLCNAGRLTNNMETQDN